MQLSPTGEMVHAQVQLTMKQSDKGDAKGGGSATQSKKNKKGTGNTSTKAEQKENAKENAKEIMRGKLKSREEIIKKAWRLSGNAKTTLSTGRTLLTKVAYSDV